MRHFTFYFTFQDSVAQRMKDQQRGRFDLLATLNERRCSETPIYGSDLIECLTITRPTSRCGGRFTGALAHQVPRKKLCDCLCDMIKLPKQRINERKGITDRLDFNS